MGKAGSNSTTSTPNKDTFVISSSGPSAVKPSMLAANGCRGERDERGRIGVGGGGWSFHGTGHYHVDTTQVTTM